MTYFNATKMVGWTDLTDTERWHAGYCARKLDDSGLVNEWRYGCPTLVNFTSLAEDEKFYFWFIESLLVALTEPEKLTAFRAYVQARTYRERAEHTECFSDSLAIAHNRIEDFLR